MGFFCDEPSGNKQMAHSQIAVVIAFSLTFEMDVRLVFHRRPLGNVGFHRQLPFTMICSGMLMFFLLYNNLFTFVLVFMSAGAFAFVFLSVVVVCFRSLPFAIVCLFSCALALVCIVCCLAVNHSRICWSFMRKAKW